MKYQVAEFNAAGQYRMRDTGLSNLDIMRIVDTHKRTCRGRVPRVALQDLSDALAGRITIGLDMSDISGWKRVAGLLLLIGLLIGESWLIYRGLIWIGRQVWPWLK